MSVRNICGGFLAVLVLAFIGLAQQNVVIKKVPIKYVSPAAGQQMYASYCADCHGVDGRGVGRAAGGLKTPAADLTTLAKRNHGKYPGVQVFQTIRGDLMFVGHGEKDMPVWSRTFRNGPNDAEIHARIATLTRYVESLQEK